MGRREAQREKEQALQEKEKAEKDAERGKAVVEKTQTNMDLASQMRDTAQTHETLWDGMSKAAVQAANTFSQLRHIDPSGARRKRFEDKMKTYTSHLLAFVQASILDVPACSSFVFQSSFDARLDPPTLFLLC